MASREYRYRIEKKKVLAENPICQIRICCKGNPATEVHHPYGRVGENLFRELLPACRLCHNWVEAYPIDAKRLGFSKNRIT